MLINASVIALCDNVLVIFIISLAIYTLMIYMSILLRTSECNIIKYNIMISLCDIPITNTHYLRNNAVMGRYLDHLQTSDVNNFS